jgi:hypothetical protein
MIDWYVQPVVNPDGYAYSWSDVSQFIKYIQINNLCINFIYIYLFIYRIDSGEKLAAQIQAQIVWELMETGTLISTGEVSYRKSL